MNYSDYISTLRQMRQNRIFMSSDNEERKTVYLELIKSADSNLRFLAGNLCDEITNSEEFVEAISDFIEKKGQIEIILNQYNEEIAKESNLYKRLAYYSAQNYSISVQQTSATVSIGNTEKETPAHFAVADLSSFILEMDIEKRIAICNMNDVELTKKLTDIFEQISSNPETYSIDLVNLFSLKQKG